MLTAKQSTCLAAIRNHIAEHGLAPTYTELMEALDLKSLASVSRLVTAIEEKGHIRRLPRRARTIEVVDNDMLDRALAAVDEVGDYATVAAYQDAIKRAVG